MIEIEIYKRKFIMRLGSHDWRLKNLTICCLQENQERGGINQFETKGLRTRKANGIGLKKGRGGYVGFCCKSWSPNAQEPGTPMSKCKRRRMAQLKKTERILPSSALLLCLGPPVDSMMPVHIGKGRMLYSVYWLKR